MKTRFIFWDMLTWDIRKVCLQTFRNNRVFLKLAYFLRNLQISRANNSQILRIENAKFSGYCFYMNTNIQGDFKICISVPLILELNLINLQLSSWKNQLPRHSYFPELFLLLFTTSTVELTSHIVFLCFKDVNECAEGKDNCDQLCTNTIGSYNCMCRDGYYLHQDGRTCVGKSFLNH